MKAEVTSEKKKLYIFLALNNLVFLYNKTNKVRLMNLHVNVRYSPQARGSRTLTLEFVQKTKITETAMVIPSASIRKKDTRKKYCRSMAMAVHRIYRTERIGYKYKVQRKGGKKSPQSIINKLTNSNSLLTALYSK